jgi:type I restriction enzyme, S subunit
MSASVTQAKSASDANRVSAVTPGHKRTDIGVIPDDWQVLRLGDVCRIRTGAKDVNEGSPSGQYPFFTCSRQHTYCDAYSFDAEAILIAGNGDVGNLHYYSGRFEAYQRTYVLSGFSANVWLAWHQMNAHLVAALGVGTIGSSIPYIKKGNLLEFQYASPTSLPEQRAIAGALSDVDGLIGALEKLIAKKRAIKQAAMHQLLTGKTRLPGFSGQWEEKTVGDFTDCTAGGTPSTQNAEYWGGSIRWMNSGELNLKVVWEVEGRITEEGLRNSSTKMVPLRCVLIGLAGQGKTRGTVAMNMVPLCVNQSIAAVFPNDAFVPKFLYFVLDAMYDELRAMSTGDGGRGGLNLRIIRSIVVPFPSFDEQQAIATVLSDMDGEAAAMEQRRDKTKMIKLGMMQELLTGRIRLVKPEAAV